MSRLAGKIAVVTGAGNGIGKAIAERFAAEGARLAIGDLEADAVERTAAAIRASGSEVITTAADLTEEAGAEALVQSAIDSFGGLDILVNNLGGSRNQKIWEMSVEDWDFVMRLNLRGTFLCTRAAARIMKEQRSGRIICLSSGSREGTPWTAYYQGGAAYSTVKAGVHGFIRDVALELAEFNITVNAVAPGPIDTERTGPGLRKMDETLPFSPSKVTPLGRLGTPAEVAAAAVFLASDEASYVSGHTLAVAGGR
jgi:NAD(P)-dependent dehydrogenase (short-subunit alcohol dehydrogenase family)